MSQSLIDEQYQLAARERRAMDSARVSTAEYIDVSNSDHWKCRCGNTPTAQGFYPFNRESWRYVEPDVGWDGRTWRCDRCKRVIVAPHGYVWSGPIVAQDVQA